MPNISVKQKEEKNMLKLLLVALAYNTTTACFSTLVTRIYLCQGGYLNASNLLPTGIVQQCQ